MEQSDSNDDSRSGRLTPKRIKNARAMKGDIWLTDNTGVRGAGRLALRVSKEGPKRFYFRGTINGRRQAIPLGPYSHVKQPGYLTLGEARQEARRQAALYLVSEAAITSGAPVNKPIVQVGDAKAGSVVTVLDLCNEYVADLQRRDCAASSIKDMNGFIRREIANSALAALPAAHVTSDHVVEFLRGILESGRGNAAAKVRAALSAAFSAALGARLDPGAPSGLKIPGLQINPVQSVSTLSEHKGVRERALSKTELASLWRRLKSPERHGYVPDAARIVRLMLLLGGQRLTQLIVVPVSAVNFEAKTITLLDPKGSRDKARIHILPILPNAETEIRLLVDRSQSLPSPWLFASTKFPDKTITPSRPSQLVTKICKEMLATKESKAHFQLSDLRRTAETVLAELDIHKDVRAQLLSHGLSGVQDRVYDRHTYLKQKREALQIWEQFLDSLLAPKKNE